MFKLNQSFLLHCLAIIGVSSFSANSLAVDWAVSGFGTLGYTYENDNELAYRRDSSHVSEIGRNGSFASDSRLGLQLDASFNRQWSLTTQLLLDDSVEHDIEEIAELAFIRYEPNANWSFRVGRVGVSAYAASDSRYIDYAHLWVRPPQELYSGIAFNTLDGVGASYYSNHPDFNWSVNLEYGQSRQVGELPTSQENYRTKLDDVVSVSFEVDQQSWHWQLSYAQVGSLSVQHGASIEALQNQLTQLASANVPQVSSDAAALSQALSVSQVSGHYLQAAVTYFDGDWTLQSELFQIRTGKESVPQGYGGYALVGKAFDKLTPYIIYGQFKSSTSPHSFPANNAWAPLLNAGVLGVNAVRIDQSTYSLGVRWDISPQVAIKAQLDHVEIDENGYGLWVTSLSDIGQANDVQLYSLHLNFVF
ncbi:hypothetical protein H2O73_16050 [Vibrio sp. 404]|uniref:Porin n=1 Tax=Vibrio marinisediminis TaxID=2758441 RepID=A0A7W2FTB2_9VIBR|nr:hypothetical protein [Vibrio marinisediminis]MBA5763876.1 hypothetical protein [Vibrio marinisediminis]